MSEFHRVRTHHWIKGVLKYVDHAFNSFEDALAFAMEHECDNFKIFDGNDGLKHSSHGKKIETYA
jgi:hypothetical protein